MAGANGQTTDGIIAGINVTPLVDVMLVLLVIFIVTAKIIVTPAVPLDLPHAAHGEEVQVILSVIVPVRGPMLVNGAPVPSDDALIDKARAGGRRSRAAGRHPSRRRGAAQTRHPRAGRSQGRGDLAGGLRSASRRDRRNGKEVTRKRSSTSVRADRDRSPRIAELVFAGEPPGRADGRLMVAGGAVLALYAATFTIVSQLGRSAGPWSAEMAARVHDAIAAERAVDVTPPPPPTPAAIEPARLAPARIARAPRVARAAPAAPAQAAQLAAASPAPADFTGLAFVVGSGASYAGGVTTSKGTSRTPVSGAVAPGGTGQGGAQPSRARAPSRSIKRRGAAPGPPRPTPSR